MTLQLPYLSPQLGLGLASVSVVGITAATLAIIPVIILLVKSFREAEIPIEMLLLNYSLTILLQLIKMAIFDVATMLSSDWLFGHLVCVGTGFLNALLHYSTLAQLGILAVDRYVCLRYFRNYEVIMTKWRVYGCILLPWGCAAYTALLHTVTPGGISFQHGAYRCDVSPQAGITSLVIQAGTRMGSYALVIGMLVIVCRVPISGKNVLRAVVSNHAISRRRTATNKRLDGQLVVTRVVGVTVMIRLSTDLITLALSIKQSIQQSSDITTNTVLLSLQILSTFLAPLPFYLFGDKVRGTALKWLKCSNTPEVLNRTFKFINHGRVFLHDGQMTLNDNNNRPSTADIEVGLGQSRFWGNSPSTRLPDIKESQVPSNNDMGAGGTSPPTMTSASKCSDGEFEITLCSALAEQLECSPQMAGLFGTKVDAQSNRCQPKRSCSFRSRASLARGGKLPRLSTVKSQHQDHRPISRHRTMSVPVRPVSAKSLKWAASKKSAADQCAIREAIPQRIKHILQRMQSTPGILGDGVDMLGLSSDRKKMQTFTVNSYNLKKDQSRRYRKKLSSNLLSPPTMDFRAVSPGLMTTMARPMSPAVSIDSTQSWEEYMTEAEQEIPFTSPTPSTLSAGQLSVPRFSNQKSSQFPKSPKLIRNTGFKNHALTPSQLSLTMSRRRSLKPTRRRISKYKVQNKSSKSSENVSMDDSDNDDDSDSAGGVASECPEVDSPTAGPMLKVLEEPTEQVEAFVTPMTPDKDITITVEKPKILDDPVCECQSEDPESPVFFMEEYSLKSGSPSLSYPPSPNHEEPLQDPSKKTTVPKNRQPYFVQSQFLGEAMTKKMKGISRQNVSYARSTSESAPCGLVLMGCSSRQWNSVDHVHDGHRHRLNFSRHLNDSDSTNPKPVILSEDMELSD